jgi:hypothetical protein
VVEDVVDEVGEGWSSAWSTPTITGHIRQKPTTETRA